MSEIPSDLLSREILSRFPAKSLLRLRCVCTAWRDILRDPTFIKLHLDRQMKDSSNGVRDLILRGEMGTALYSLSFISIDSNNSQILRAKPLNHIPFHNYGLSSILTESCNGIMLISIRSKRDKILWNPLTRKYHKLPPLMEFKKSLGLFHSVIALGYNPSCDDYMVVKISQVFDPRYRSFKSETSIYSMKLDSWKKIIGFPYRISRSRGGIFLNGALHWVCKDIQVKCSDDLIVALDLVTENYRLMQLPCTGLEKVAKHLGMLDGCLSLSCYYEIECFDVWLMGDYGVESSWTRLFSISRGDNIGAVETLRPVSYSKRRREVLLQHDKKELLWFDLETHTSKKIWIHGCPSTFSSHICLEGLVHLDSGGGGRNSSKEKSSNAN